MTDAPPPNPTPARGATSPDLVLALSRDEVLAILTLMQVDTMPGLGDEPIPNLTAEQRAYGLIVAERGLRARGLATINEAGQLLIQTPVLQMVGGCALADESLFVTQVAAPSGGAAAQVAAHRWRAAWTLHSRPDAALHAFRLVEGWPRVWEELAALCGWPAGSIEGGYRLTVPNETLAQARELAAGGQAAQATTLLGAGNAADAAHAVVAVLAQPHIVTVLQHATPQGGGDVALQSVTVLHNDTALLVAVEARGGVGSTTLLQPTTREGLQSVVEGLIQGK